MADLSLFGKLLYSVNAQTNVRCFFASIIINIIVIAIEEKIFVYLVWTVKFIFYFWCLSATNYIEFSWNSEVYSLPRYYTGHSNAWSSRPSTSKQLSTDVYLQNNPEIVSCEDVFITLIVLFLNLQACRLQICKEAGRWEDLHNMWHCWFSFSRDSAW